MTEPALPSHHLHHQSVVGDLSPIGKELGAGKGAHEVLASRDAVRSARPTLTESHERVNSRVNARSTTHSVCED